MAAVTALVAVGVPAGISIWRLKQELKEKNELLAKGKRADVITEWQEYADRLQKQVDTLTEEGKSQRAELAALSAEVADMRKQITARETERVEQRTEIRTLEKTVQDLDAAKQPSTEPQEVIVVNPPTDPVPTVMTEEEKTKAK